MLRTLKWSLISIVALFVIGLLHYTLPQHDVVRIVGANTQRIDLGENAWFFAAPDAGTSATVGNNRDVKFIETILASNGRPMVYRNEDTSWGWPPYFKVNSFDVQAQASDLTSTAAAPRWVVMTHYGWRNQFFTIFPNAVRLRVVDSPDVTLIPWASIIILSLLALLAFMARRMWMQFRERTIDPALEDAGEAWDAVDARADAARAQATGAWGRFVARMRGHRRPR